MLSLNDENQEKNLEKNRKSHPFYRLIGFFTDAATKFLGKMRKLKNQIYTKRFWYWFFAVFSVLLVFSIVSLIVLFIWFSKDLPTPTKVVRREGYSSQVLDRNGEVIFDLYNDTKRTPVAWEDMPEALKKATIAVEDKDFYKHKGFDPLTPLRIIKNFFTMGRITGGSTLTQQLVKNVLLSNERTVNRKIKEFILAVQIDAKYSKDEILLMYLNEAPYGGAAWGVGSGAEQYFGKEVKDLDVTESVILAGLPQRPSVYSPFSKTPTAYVDRTRHVIERMVEDGYMTKEEGDAIFEKAKNYKFFENKDKNLAPHFLNYIKDEIAAKYGEEAIEIGGLTITTTLDAKIQKETQKIVSEEIDKSEKLGISNGAAIVLDPRTGEILAMVGSRDYFSDKTDGNFNVVTQGLRQPGSSIKPVTYVTALKKGWTPESMIVDAAVKFPATPGQTKDYEPQNYSGKYNGPMSIRNALGNSINTVAVKMLYWVGVENMLRQAYEMGITTLQPTKENLSRFGLSVTLGGGEVKMSEMATAYCAFANGGKKVEMTGILKIQDRDGRVLEEFKPIAGKQVLTPQEAFLISNILSDNSAREITFGNSSGLSVSGYQVAVKTGTTNDKRDNWTIGWTPNLLVDVWVGNNDNSPMGKVASGISGASPIWRRIMLSALPNRNKEDFPIPDKIISMDSDRISGYAAHDGFPAKTSYFIDGMQPKTQDPIHLKLKVCRGKSGLATPEDVNNGNYEEKEYIRLKEDCPNCQAGIDAWILEQTDRDKYYPPSDYCRSDGMVTVDFETPGNEQTLGGEFDVKIKTSSVNKITEVRVWANGSEKLNFSEKPFEGKITLADGTYTLKVEAKDKNGNFDSEEIKIGVNMPWSGPLPTATPMIGITIAPTISVMPGGT